MRYSRPCKPCLASSGPTVRYAAMSRHTCMHHTAKPKMHEHTLPYPRPSFHRAHAGSTLTRIQCERGRPQSLPWHDRGDDPPRHACTPWLAPPALSIRSFSSELAAIVSRCSQRSSLGPHGERRAAQRARRSLQHLYRDCSIGVGVERQRE